MQSTRSIDTREVRKALKDTRRFNRMVDGYLNTRDLTSAYSAAERMQHAAFEAKRLIANGGTYQTDPEDR